MRTLPCDSFARGGEIEIVIDQLKDRLFLPLYMYQAFGVGIVSL